MRQFIRELVGNGGAAVPETDLVESDARLVALQGIFATAEFDLDGHFRRANPRLLTALGYSEAQLVGQHHRRVVSAIEAEGEIYARFWQELREGRPQAATYRRIRSDGRSVWLNAAYCPFRGPDGRLAGVLKLASDVTREREALDAGQAIVELSMDRRVLCCNQRFEALVGYTADELVGQPHSALVDDDFARSQAYADHWARLLRGEFVTGVFRRVGKRGREIFMQASYTPVLDQDGRPLKVVKMAQDVTASRRAVGEMLTVVGRLRDATRSLTETSRDVQGTAEDVAAHAETMQTESSSARRAMGSVSASTEEMASSVQEIASQAESAATESQECRRASQNASGAMEELGSAIDSIQHVVQLIRTITDQTKLLALNANIEAASAGAAGRGFKVVADEVRALSNQTTEATAKVAEQLGLVRDTMTRARDAVGRLDGLNAQVEERQSRVASAAQQQGTATNEVAALAAEVAQLTEQVSASAEGLNASAGQGRSTAERVVRVTRDVGAVVEQLESLSRALQDG